MPGSNALGNALSFVPTLLRARHTAQKLLARLGWLAIAGLIVCGAMAPIAAAQGTTPSQSALQFTNSQTATFTCNVIGPRISGVPGPTGTVTITDLTDSQTLGTATLGTPSQPALFYYGTVNTGSTNATYGAVQIANGDFNGDDNQDIAAIVQDQFQSNLPDALTILLGNGDGTFQVSPPIVLSSGPVGGIVAADFNGDGKLDLAVATSTGVEIFLGNGDGTFESPRLITLPGILGQIIAGKFISTGNVDLAVANTANSFGDNPTIDVLLGNGDGTFQSPVAYPLTNFTSLLLATGDFRGNGTLDLAFVSSVGSDGTTTSSAVGVMLGNGDGTFQAPVTVAMPTAVYIDDFALGNMTTSGHLDVVASGSGFSTVLLGNGDGTLQTPATIQYGPANGTTFYPGGSALLDLNGDGNLDLVVDGYSGTVPRAIGFSTAREQAALKLRY
jgi:FG-GAP-like repeat